jgi:hypothetical protein
MTNHAAASRVPSRASFLGRRGIELLQELASG